MVEKWTPPYFSHLRGTMLLVFLVSLKRGFDLRRVSLKRGRLYFVMIVSIYRTLGISLHSVRADYDFVWYVFYSVKY